MKLTLAVLVLLSAAAFAQSSKNPVTDVLRDSLAGRQKNTVAAIEEMPAEQFSFKPTPEQMSFGHLAAHIVEGNYFFCAKVGDVPQPKFEVAQLLRKRKTLSSATQSRISVVNLDRVPGRPWLSPVAGLTTTAPQRCTSG
jgi:hypothetical protein